MTYIFDGRSFAKQQEEQLRLLVAQMEKKPVVHTFVFTEDEGSRIYTRLKQQAAVRIGIQYIPHEYTFADDVNAIASAIIKSSEDPKVTGVMVQKPSKAVWLALHDEQNGDDFSTWWQTLTNVIDPGKDVDCLSQANLERIAQRTAIVLPATVQACLTILEQAKRHTNVSDEEWKQRTIAIVGKSDIVGRPLFEIVRTMFLHVENFGSKDDLNRELPRFDIVISAVGKPGLITGNMVRQGVIVIDVGSPLGDFEHETVLPKAEFLTPVPGGVGPLTVASLMENIVTLSK